MKDFLTSSNENFLKMCQNVVDIMNMSISDQTPSKMGCQVIAVEKTMGQWRNTKKLPRLINFYRITENLDQNTVGSLMKRFRRSKRPGA